MLEGATLANLPAGVILAIKIGSVTYLVILLFSFRSWWRTIHLPQHERLLRELRASSEESTVFRRRVLAEHFDAWVEEVRWALALERAEKCSTDLVKIAQRLKERRQTITTAEPSLATAVDAQCEALVSLLSPTPAKKPQVPSGASANGFR